MMPDHRPIRIEYYAKLREAMGCAAEDIALPRDIATAGALIDWLRDRDDAGRMAIDDKVHVALDDVIAQPATSLDGTAVVAVFPPMTGG